ncbi:MAG TPA: diacylglycerol kinase family lipid kinase [Desulfuromonadales bacterium]|nr:diacylglycerol kinase family lipid kinase [Desulfuromonadales bacterium]
MDTYLFVNPRSGRYGRRRIETAIKSLTIAGICPKIFPVNTPGDALAYCCTINETSQNPLIIIAAGDGTANAVINGLQYGTATLAILPLGTSNVLSAELGITSLEDGIQRIIAGKTRSLTVGVLELEESSHRFVLMAGVGVDGSIVRDVHPLLKRLVKQGAYAFSAITGSLGWVKSMITVKAGGRTINCHSVIACNASKYAGNFVLASDSDISLPELTAVCITKNSRRTYIRLALELALGRSDTSSELLRLSVNGLEISGTKPIQIDGDFVGYSPARIRVLPNFARIIF